MTPQYIRPRDVEIHPKMELCRRIRRARLRLVQGVTGPRHAAAMAARFPRPVFSSVGPIPCFT